MSNMMIDENMSDEDNTNEIQLNDPLGIIKNIDLKPNK